MGEVGVSAFDPSTWTGEGQPVADAADTASDSVTTPDEDVTEWRRAELQAEIDGLNVGIAKLREHLAGKIASVRERIAALEALSPPGEVSTDGVVGE